MRLPSVFSAAMLAGLTAPMSATAQSGVEEGVDELAREIVARSDSDTATTIAIAAFPHVDDTCSELSNFLVDELVLSLFDVPEANLQIIERSQLGRIFAELELSMSGAVDANTTQELGRIHGVDTLLVGSLTTLGDNLRVNARMLNTETGRVFSAAAVNIAKTSTVEDLMDKPSAAGCTLAPERSASGGETRTAGQDDSSGGAPTPSIPAFEGDVKMEKLVGNWSGQWKCGNDVRPIALKLSAPSSIGLQYAWYNASEVRGLRIDAKGTLNYDVTETGGKNRFILSIEGGIPVKLISEDTFYGEFENEKGKECSLSFGKYN